MPDKTAIILAGGFSSRLGRDKGLVSLVDKPLVRHVLDRVKDVVDEKIVVVSSDAQAEQYAKVAGSNAKIVKDKLELQSPLVGTLTGLEAAEGKYALVLPCDAPFVSGEVVSLLFDLCANKAAVIPRWPSGYIEPLQSVYCTKPARDAAEGALSEGGLNLRCMVDKLRGVRYVSTIVLQQIDPELKTFFNINTPLELKKAENMLKHT